MRSPANVLHTQLHKYKESEGNMTVKIIDVDNRQGGLGGDSNGLPWQWKSIW